jgi:hypothetical protein
MRKFNQWGRCEDFLGKYIAGQKINIQKNEQMRRKGYLFY